MSNFDPADLSASLLASLQARTDNATASDRALTDEELADCTDFLTRIWGEARDVRDNLRPTEAEQFPHAFGRFVVRRLIGHGTYSAVFESFDPVLSRVCALKIPRPEVLMNPVLRRRFERDAEVSAQLRHAHIVPIYEVGHVGPVCFTVAELVAGPNLAEWLNEHDSPLSARAAAAIAVAVADAITHAHEHGFLHRDLKPSNVLLESCSTVSEHGLAFVPKLADFGLAKEIDLTKSQTIGDVPIGTAAYMSPEQAAGKAAEVGVGSDIYSLGVVLFELLTRRRPFAGDSLQQLLRTIAEEDAPSVRAIRPDLPVDLAAIVDQALAKEITCRYRSAREFGDDLRRFLQRRPVIARPIGPLRRAVRWTARRPALAATGMALLVAVCSGFLGILWQWRIADANRRLSDAHAARAERHLQEAYRLLTELGLVAQESEFSREAENPFQAMWISRLSEEFVHLLARPDLAELPRELRAVAYGAEGRRLLAHQSHQAAEDMLRKSIAAWEAVVSAHPENRKYRRAYVVSLYSLGMAMSTQGNSSATATTLAEASESLKEALEKNHDPRVLDEYATMCMEIGAAFVRLGRTEDAARLFAQSLEQFEKLWASKPDDPHTLFRVAQLERFVGSQQANLRSRTEAEQHFQSALEKLERLIVMDPQHFAGRFDLAETHRVYGSLLADRRDPAAKVHFQRGLDLTGELLKDRVPDEAMVRTRAGLARGLAYAHLRERNDAAAGHAFQQAVECFDEWDRLALLLPHELEQYGLLAYQAAVLSVEHGDGRYHAQFSTARHVFERIPVRNRKSPRAQVAYAHALLVDGDTKQAAGDRNGARADYESARALLQKLHDRGRREPAITERLRHVQERLVVASE